MVLQVARALPTPRKADGTADSTAPRGTGYGEPYVQLVNREVWADEGGYFIGRNVTPGTAVAGHTAPTTHDTEKALIFIKNTLAAPGRRVYLDYIRLALKTAGTAGTIDYATHTVDDGRTYSSGGGDITVLNPNMAAPANDSVITIAKFGAVVPGEANSNAARIVHHSALRAQVIPVVGDVLLFVFGGEPGIASGSLTEGVLESERLIPCPPIILGSGHSYHLVLWRPSQSAAATYELNMGWHER